MGLGASVIKVVITGDTKGFDKAAEKTEHKAEGMGSKLKGIATAGFAAVGVAAVAAGAYALEAGMKLQESQDQLRNSLKNSGSSWDANKKAIEAAVQANEKYGTTSDITEHLLAQGVNSTGSLTKSTKLLALAQNIAASSGKPLADVFSAVTKASFGQLKPLKALNIDLPIAAGGALKTAKAQAVLAKANQALQSVQEKFHHGLLKGPAYYTAYVNAQNKVKDAQDKLNTVSHAGGDIIGILSKKYKGAADVGAESLSGKMKALHAKIHDFAATLGTKMIPTLTKWVDYTTKNIIPAMYKLGDWLSKHKLVLAGVAIAIGLLVAPWITVVAALVYAYTHFEKFRDIVNTTLTTTVQYIKKFVSWAQAFWKNFGQSLTIYAKTYWGAIKSVIKGVMEVIRGIIKVVTSLIHGDWSGAWNGIKMIFKGVWDAIGGILRAAIGQIKLALSLAWDLIGNTIHGAWDSIVSFFEGLPGRLGGAALRMGQSIYNGIKDGISGALGFVGDIAGKIKDLINQFILDPVRNVEIKWGGFHGIGAFDIHPFGFIPRLHSGGVYDGGRGSQREGLAMLQNGEGIFTPSQMRALGVGAGGIRGGGNFIVHMPAGTDPAGVVRAQKRWQRRNGSTAAA